MRENTKQDIKTFTVGFENQPDYNEIKYSEMVSKLFQTNHFIKIVSADGLIGLY